MISDFHLMQIMRDLGVKIKSHSFTRKEQSQMCEFEADLLHL